MGDTRTGRSERPMGSPPAEWVPGDVERLEDWAARNRRAARHPRRIFVVSSGLVVLSMLSLTYIQGQVPRTRWSLVPIVAVWASLTVAAVSAVVVFYNWRVQRIIRAGVIKASRALGPATAGKGQ